MVIVNLHQGETMADQIGLYLVKVLVQKPGVDGAPSVQLNLAVNPGAGVVGGNAVITQAVAPPHGSTTVPEVRGVIHHTGLGVDKMLVSVEGQYGVSVPPPAIGTYLAKFSAALAVDNTWKGTGSFTYAGGTIEGCTVTPVD